MKMIPGTKLQADDMRHVLAAYVHRYTGEHKPKWAHDGYAVQFRDDNDWLAHTRFAVTKDGRLDRRVKHCESAPTWPNGRRPSPPRWPIISPED